MGGPAKGGQADGAALAASRLRHDLGKYIRFSAPETIELGTDALRDRLRADVLSTRQDTSGPRSAAEVFEQWLRQEAMHFPAGGALGERVARIAQTIDEIRGLAAEIDTLDRAALEQLDRLTRIVAEECRSLAFASRDLKEKAP